jgi:hypothetical protein
VEFYLNFYFSKTALNLCEFSNLLDANVLLECEDLRHLYEWGGVAVEVDGHIAGQAALTVQIGGTVTQWGDTWKIWKD